MLLPLQEQESEYVLEQIFIIIVRSSCTSSELSILLTSCLTTVKSQNQCY